MTAQSSIVALLVLSMLVCGLFSPVAAQTARSDFIHAEGKRLVSPDGTTFLVKGVNLGHWLVPEGYMFGFNRKTEAPGQIRRLFERLLGGKGAARLCSRFRDGYIAQDDVTFIGAAGYNTVRVPLDYRMFVTAGADPKFEGIGYALIDRLVGWAKKSGVRVILDLHAAPGGQVGASHDGGDGFPLLFYSRAHQDLTIRLWRTIAQRYRDEPTVLGFDLLNEPIAPHHDTKYLEPRLQPLLERLTKAVREVAPHQVIFIEGSRWGTSWHALGAPFAGNLVYTYHSYWASPRRNTIQPQLNFRDRYNVPILIAETGEAQDQWISDFRTMHEAYGIGWIFWPYKNLNQTTTVASVPMTAEWKLVIDFADRFADDPNATPPAQTVIDRAFEGYLKAIEFKNCDIRWSYLAALGLKAAP
ncbi:MAG: glycoside hydrolase family 5 [Bradyrhizobium sp.]|nr:glycoside hydrolase family 5 [Bradyrhizobium sp.]